MKKITLLTIVALSTLFVGCKSPQSAYLISKSATFVGARIGLRQVPEARPYLTAAALVICEAAHGTNASPDALIESLKQLEPTTQDAAIILNGLLSLWLSYDVENPERQAVLLGNCDGLNLALAFGERQPLGVPYVKQ